LELACRQTEDARGDDQLQREQRCVDDAQRKTLREIGVSDNDTVNTRGHGGDDEADRSGCSVPAGVGSSLRAGKVTVVDDVGGGGAMVTLR
jgi:hypothetical protein